MDGNSFTSLGTIKTVYGQIDDHILTELPSKGRYHIRSCWLRLKPTWFNLSHDWRSNTYEVIKAFETIIDNTNN
jgi:hypothetical protein